MVQTFAAALAAYKDRTTLIGDSATVLPGIEMLHAPGHTPGQMAVRIKHGKESFVIVGDAFHTRVSCGRQYRWRIQVVVT